MISAPAIIFAAITLFLSLVFPILAAVWFVRKYRVGIGVIFAGALTFVVFQLVLRLPLLQLLSARFPGIVPDPGNVAALFGFTVFLALTAALFEEGGRWLVYRFVVRKKADW